jgi:hypothetical protein
MWLGTLTAPNLKLYLLTMTVAGSYLQRMNIKNKQELKITENAFGKCLLQTE